MQLCRLKFLHPNIICSSGKTGGFKIHLTVVVWGDYVLLVKGEIMNDIDIRDFVEGALLGEDLEFSLHGKKYFCEGWLSDGQYTLCLFEPGTNPVNYLWFQTGPDRDVLAEDLLSAPIFEGKSFWEANSEMKWVY